MAMAVAVKLPIREAFRAMFDGDGMVVAPGCYDGLAGTLIARAGAAGVYPNDESENIAGLGKVEADDAWSLGLTSAYMATDNIGIGLLGAWPFEHDIDGSSGALDDLGTVAETKHLPPTLTAQYHFDLANDKVHPFLGAGMGVRRVGRTVEMTGLSARVSDGEEVKGLDALVTQARRAQVHGFTESELERTRRDFRESGGVGRWE